MLNNGSRDMYRSHIKCIYSVWCETAKLAVKYKKKLIYGLPVGRILRLDVSKQAVLTTFRLQSSMRVSTREWVGIASGKCKDQ